MSVVGQATSIRAFRRRVATQIRDTYQLYLIILLPLGFIVIFHYLPIYGLLMAFQNFSPARGMLGGPWVGLQHFRRFLTSPLFARVFSNTLILSVYWIAAGFPIPIVLALALNNTLRFRYKRLVQMVTYAPFFISVVVLVGMMYQLFSPKFGIVNHLITLIGGDPVLFMSRPEHFRHMFVWSVIWQNTGWAAIIYVASLSSVDVSLHEAAIVDGANRLRRVVSIDLPSIAPTIVVLLILRLGNILTLGFERALLMQNPLNLLRSEIISTYVYKVAFQSSLPNYSYATAIGMFNSVINFTVLVVVNRTARRIGETSLW